LEEVRSKFIEGSIIIPKLLEYVDLRDNPTKPILPHPAVDYEIPVLEVLMEVHIKGRLLGCIADLRSSDHDLTNVKKFPYFQPDTYLTSEHGGEVFLPVTWAAPIHQSTILNAIHLPHFGRSQEVNVVTKILLSEYTEVTFGWIPLSLLIRT